jgi:hypothetical protein
MAGQLALLLLAAAASALHHSNGPQLDRLLGDAGLVARVHNSSHVLHLTKQQCNKQGQRSMQLLPLFWPECTELQKKEPLPSQFLI